MKKCVTVPKISVSLHGVLVSIFNVCPQDLKAVCIHPAHICLSCCLQDGLLYCLNSCVSGNAANLCHCADFLLSKDTTAGVHCLKMNTGILCLSQCALLFFTLSVWNRGLLKSTFVKSLEMEENEKSIFLFLLKSSGLSKMCWTTWTGSIYLLWLTLTGPLLEVALT